MEKMVKVLVLVAILTTSRRAAPVQTNGRATALRSSTHSTP